MSKQETQSIREQNKAAWNIAAKHFYGGGALPCWGALGEESNNPNLIGEIIGKTFLEIGCGSGHSIDYLIKQGAEKVYGLDLSEEQIKFAQELNQKAIALGKVELFNKPMEEESILEQESVDTAFSIYGIGWTQDIQKTLSNIYCYLKPGGRLIFSFETQLFARTQFDKETASFAINGSSHEEYTKELKDWFGAKASITYHLPNTWIRYCLDLDFKLIDYFEPRPLFINTEDPDLMLYYDKAKVEKIAPTFIMIFKK